jgi:hypothetical protein
MTQRQMQLSEILLNPSIKEKDELRLSNQAKKIYDLLKLGPVTTSEAAAIAKQYNARINEIRHILAPLGLMIDELEGQGGENSYLIVELERSTFWKEKKEKGEEWKWNST